MANQYDRTPFSTETEIEERRYEVLKLRRIGMDWAEIAHKIGQMFGRRISPSQCAEDFRKIMALRAKELHEETDAIRASQMFRINQTINRIWSMIDADKPNLEAVETLIKLETRMARLMGTDAPVKTEDVSKPKEKQLTEGQLREKMQELMERIRRRQSTVVEVSPIPAVIEGQVVETSQSLISELSEAQKPSGSS